MTDLPVDIDSTYPDRSAGDALHQQHHDLLHALYNLLRGSGGSDATVTTRLEGLLATALAGKQPLDADLTAIAALVTTAYGRGLLTDADAAAFKSRLQGLLDGTYAPRTGLYLPGVSGNYVSTPDHASLDITGDIDLRAYVALDVWTPSTAAAFVSKWNGTAYHFDLSSDGKLNLFWSQGAAVKSATSSVAVGAANGAAKWVRSVLDVNNGSGGHDVEFFTSDDGQIWTPLGAKVTGAGVTSIDVSTSPLEVGRHSSVPANVMIGKVYRAQIRNGINGTVVADYRADTPMGPRYRDSTGKIWTINGSAWSWMVA